MNTAPGAKLPIRIAVVGCGAVARRFYLPVLAGHPGVRLSALVDPELQRATALARDYRVELVRANAVDLSANAVDAAIVCTPPRFHAEVTAALARQGIHALVEKPMATDLAAAEAMTEAAERAGVVLAVALFTRLLPSSRLAKALLQNGWLGAPLELDVRYGRIYDWPAATLGNLSRELSGGGVLLDSGSHLLDQLIYFFGADATVRRYRDNSRGGVESDCRLDLDFRFSGRTVEGTIELSRTRELRNTLEIACQKGTIELRLDERQRLTIRPKELRLHDSLSGNDRDFELGLGFRHEAQTAWFEAFRLEIDDFLAAIHQRRAPVLAARSALPSLRLIDECYRRAEPLDEPGSERARVIPGSRPGRVLITGATGFLGCRAAELLCLRHGWQVRAAVHTPANARRLACLPVELITADLRSMKDARRLVEGCDAVVHCALGTERDARAVTVGGTHNIAEAAREARVRRFVHISSIAVYGLAPGATLDESMPLRPARGDGYAEDKALAETAILEATARGLWALILRPTRIYGPFSEPFVARPLRDLRRGQLSISRSAVGAPAQMVFVDNVVFAIVRALDAASGVASGSAFNVSDREQVSCDAFYRYFADAAELPLPIVDAAQGGKRSHPLYLRRAYALAKRISELKSVVQLAHDLLAVAPAQLRRRLGAGPPVYLRPETKVAPGEVIFPREALIRIDAVERVLGFHSLVSTPDALRQTLEWARYAEILPAAPRHALPDSRIDAAAERPC